MAEGDVECTTDGCTATHKPHMWGNIRAEQEGWFHQRNGTAWCPVHVPEWVTAWRRGKKVVQ
jgi:hypothetical protein